MHLCQLSALHDICTHVLAMRMITQPPSSSQSHFHSYNTYVSSPEQAAVRTFPVPLTCHTICSSCV